MSTLLNCLLAMVMASSASLAEQRQQSNQLSIARERARPPFEAGLQYLQREDFAAAVKSFQQATDIDSTFDMAYYMLGRTQMMTKSYVSAIIALSRCRDLHLAEASTRTLSRQEVQQKRRQRVDEINERITQLEAQASSSRYGDQVRNEIRMLQERKRQIEDAERELTPERAVPAYVSLSLGSAYFRAGRLADAEQAYRATIGADPKVGEAHSNLAVVYMETGRYDEAERAVIAAEKAGLRVVPALKDEIKKRRSRQSPIGTLNRHSPIGIALANRHSPIGNAQICSTSICARCSLPLKSM